MELAGLVGVMNTAIRKPVVASRATIVILACLVGAVLLALAAWAGWTAHTQPSRSVTISRTFDGTVSWLASDGHSGCVSPNDGSSRVCSLFIDTQPVRAGQQVHAAYEWVHVGDNGYAVLLVYGSTIP